MCCVTFGYWHHNSVCRLTVYVSVTYSILLLRQLHMTQTREQQRFTISEVAADLARDNGASAAHMWPSIARANGQLDPRCS